MLVELKEISEGIRTGGVIFVSPRTPVLGSTGSLDSYRDETRKAMYWSFASLASIATK